MANSLGITEVTLTEIIAPATLAVAAQGTLKMATKPTATNTVTIGTNVYTFVATPAVAGDVAIGALVADSQDNLIIAINVGDAYNDIHPLVVATAFDGNDDMVVTARLTGTAGNSIPSTETLADGADIWDATTLGTTTLGVTPTDANSVNGIDPAGRVSAYEPMVVRVMGHDDDTGAEEDDPYLMALFVSKSQGHPWVKDRGVLERITFEALDGTTPAESDSTYIVPFLDYSTYE